MCSSTRLDSAVFQLTPTRTRYDLVITVNGKKEKIASGLLNPFLAHLKTARDQMARGGYSIILQPEHGSDVTWFTRGTVERFVRFVSTPEILERVCTIESEIFQIEEAIAIQGNNSVGLSSVEENQVKHVENNENTFERTTSKTLQDTNEEKAIVLYKPDDEMTGSEGNSKVRLLKVLETRKSVLQKEQGMAFARAVAAGFDIDYMPALMSFAECFGASRLMHACKKFMELWKRKHETGQWLDIAAAEAMPNHADFAAVNASGIVLSNMVATPCTESDPENNGKTSADVHPINRKPSIGPQEHIQGQFSHQMFPPWSIHSSPGGIPVWPPYPVQGIPYYQNYPGNSPYMQPIYPPMEDARVKDAQSRGHRRHSMDSRYSNTESETWDIDASNSRFQDEVDMEQEGSHTGEQQKKASRSGRRKSGMVVIRNINYITKAQNSSGSASHSDSASDSDEEKDAQESKKNSKGRGSSKDSVKRLNSYENKETDHVNDIDGGHWQAFQMCLLSNNDEDRHVDQNQFELCKTDNMRRKKHVAVDDPLVSSERDMLEIGSGNRIDLHSVSRGLHRMPKASNDELLLSKRAGQSGDGRSVDDVQSSEIDYLRGGYWRTANDDFMILKNESQSNNAHPTPDLVNVSGLDYLNNNLNRKSSRNMNDDSYVVDYRSIHVSDSGNNERNAIHIDSVFRMAHQKAEKLSDETRNQINYEPDELTLMPERSAERESMGYDPALDHEMQAWASATRDKKVSADTKPGSRRLDKDQKSKVTPNSPNKRKNVGLIRGGKTSKLSPLDEARARAERLRNYKSDLQKMKKEKEEEEIKRLQALKMERQKRIAARSSSKSTPSQPTKKQLPTKLSPSSYKGSKFSDSEPGSSSPFQRRFPIRTAPMGSIDSSKASKLSRLNAGTHSAENRLIRSVSSLPETKKEKGDSTTDTKASKAHIRRLPEPKMSTLHHTSSSKPQSTETKAKTKLADETESKKISAIVNHNRSNIATLPELKIKTSKASDIGQDKSSIKEKKEKMNGIKSSGSSEGALSKKTENQCSANDDGDGNPGIEKTVMMLGCEKPSAPAIHMSQENIGVTKPPCNSDRVTEKTETMSDCDAGLPSVSPLSMDTVDRKTAESQSQEQPISVKVKMDTVENEPSKSSTSSIVEETYPAPYARISFLKNPSTGNSEYDKAPPRNLETAAIGMETVRAHVSDDRNPTLEKIPEAAEKPSVKEKSNGFRCLLKFGRKNHSSASPRRNLESGNIIIDGSEADQMGTGDSSSEVHTLKNLISQDETPTANTTPQKSSHLFSLLSPFRSKNNGKVMMA